MKKLLVLLLLSTFLYNQVGYFIAFKLEQYEVRKEIKRRLKNSVPQGELTIIAVNSNNRHEIQWVKEGKEFIYNDSFFDVVKLEENGDEIIYHCINDTQEKQLFVDLDKHVRDHMDTNSTDHKHSHKHTIKNYFTESIQVQFFTDFITVDFPSFSETLSERFGKKSVPPPELA